MVVLTHEGLGNFDRYISHADLAIGELVESLPRDDDYVKDEIVIRHGKLGKGILKGVQKQNCKVKTLIMKWRCS